MMQAIDVEKIMEEIRQDIRVKGYTEEDLSFSDIAASNNAHKGYDYSRQELEKNAAYLEAHSQNPIYFPLQGNPIKVFIQRVLRRCLLYVIFQAFQFQNKFNLSVAGCISQIRNYQIENEGLKEQIRLQQERLSMLEEKLEKLQHKVDE